MISVHAKQTLDTVTEKVLAQYIMDMASNDIGMSYTTFMLAMHPSLREVQPVELLDYAIPRLREAILRRKPTAKD